MLFSWVVDFVDLVSAEVKIQQALADYREAVRQAKAAGDELAAEWEGEAREAFVAEQEKAYQWQIKMIDIVKAVILAIKGACQKYREAEENVCGTIGRGGCGC